jgi:hypothetical protein
MSNNQTINTEGKVASSAGPIYVHCLYGITVCVRLKSAFVRTTKSAIQLRRVLYNIAQNIVRVHTSLTGVVSNDSSSTEAICVCGRVSHAL